MRLSPLAVPMVAILALLTVSEAHAQPGPNDVIPYALGSQSSLQAGCFGPCLCPVLITDPLKGTFDLKYLGFDGLFDNYQISNVNWFGSESASRLTITGSGLYRIGGEVAIQKQMTLDLKVNENPVQHFDSGLIPGTNDFPKIDILVSLRGMVCFDSVVHVQAAPAISTSVEPGVGASVRANVRVAPNPFTGETEFALELSRPAPVELTIYDIQGRAVRHLLRSTWLSGGLRTLEWDGRRDDGKPCAAGVYFARALAGDRSSLRRVIKAK